MYNLTQKTIFLLSPQPWGNMHVSKHHYAIELAKRGNRVYFVNPPDFNSDKIRIESVVEHPNLLTVSYKPFFPWNLRFHVRAVFNLLMKIQVKLLVRKIKENPDVVWCFDPNSFSKLTWFNGKLNIYHPVDPISRPDQIKVAKSAHIVFTVSKKILSAFSSVDVPKYFINHGLPDEFCQMANTNLNHLVNYLPNQPLKAGYVGNLLRKPIDRELFLKILIENRDIEFHLWGPTELNHSNISGNGDLETTEFIKTVTSLPNVVLRGVKKPEVLAHEIQAMDLFFLTYQYIENESDRSNSHKIMEYLSTGKTVISVDIETYRDADLIVMSEKNDDSELLKIFKEVKSQIIQYNSEFKMKARIEYSLKNSLIEQIRKIEEFIFESIEDRIY